jgi:putative ABC transport system ATP-binding protein
LNSQGELSLVESIELKQISKSYQEGERQQLILNQIDLTINKGEVIALVGPSGSGKTTLLNLLSGIDDPDQGSIIIHENSQSIHLNQLGEQQRTLFRRHQIGFIFQFFNLIPTLTVEENIQFPLELCNKLNSENQSLILKLLQQLGIADKRGQYPEYLSGGEQQRVAIARAIIHRPDILLADEPTGNLDAVTGQSVMDLLMEIISAYNQTMIIVTHSQEVAQRADRRLNLKNGQLQSEC